MSQLGSLLLSVLYAECGEAAVTKGRVCLLAETLKSQLINRALTLLAKTNVNDLKVMV